MAESDAHTLTIMTAHRAVHFQNQGIPVSALDAERLLIPLIYTSACVKKSMEE